MPLAWLIGALAAATPALDPALVRFLDAPAPALAKVPRGFRVIALSHLAEVAASVAADRPEHQAEAGAALDRLVELALSPSVCPFGGERALLRASLEGHGLYLSHLGVLLAARERVRRDGRYRAAHDRLARQLRDATLRDPHRHAASYPRTKVRWPADQSVTLYALWLHDRLFQGQLAAEPIRQWQEQLARAETRWKLPPSEITGSTRWSRYPRGCALSFTVRYMRPWDEAGARALWERYKLSFAVDLAAAAGFREWPPGVEGPADVDSGPIVSGVGAAATGLAIGAARAVGDEVFHQKLLSSAAIAKALGRWKRASDNLLAEAIELNGRVWRTWY